jgi:hypothetical protein
VEEVEVEVSRSFWIEAWQARLRMRRFTNDTTRHYDGLGGEDVAARLLLLSRLSLYAFVLISIGFTLSRYSALLSLGDAWT